MNTDAIYQVIVSKTLTHEQKIMKLAHYAEDSLSVLHIPEKTKHYFATGALNDLFEGAAPYRPRYILPDYEKFVAQGSAFLNISPPTDLYELLNGLQILYRHVPSITNFPVYYGNLDKLIAPFIGDLTDEQVKKQLRLFLNYLDRTITDSFSHANLGPEASRAGSLILQVEQELQNAIPNFTIKYDPDITTDAFMKEALISAVHCSNPAICNHKLNSEVFGEQYGVASCYNILPIGGGAYTLSRVTLTILAQQAQDTQHFLEILLPDLLQAMADYMNERINFLVEKSNFFESNFLAKEGLIEKDKFIGMFGVTGLAECVNWLMKDTGEIYGRDADANTLGEKIMKVIDDFATQYKAAHSPLTQDRFLLHAQVGLDTDLGVTSGVRIAINDEPESFAEHIKHSGVFHKYFTCGVGDIFPINTGCTNNIDALLDVVKGAMKCDNKYLSFYAADTDLVRITGYLVKRSEMEKFYHDEVVLQNTTHLGAPNYSINKLGERKVRMV